MRHEIEQPLNRSRAAMAHGATAQMDARRDDAAAELDRLEAAITAAGSHEMHAVASAYHQATRSRLPKHADMDAIRAKHAAVMQTWEDARQRYRSAAGDVA